MLLRNARNSLSVQAAQHTRKFELSDYLMLTVRDFLLPLPPGFLLTVAYRYVSKVAFRRLVYLTSAPITVYCTTC